MFTSYIYASLKRRRIGKYLLPAVVVVRVVFAVGVLVVVSVEVAVIGLVEAPAVVVVEALAVVVDDEVFVVDVVVVMPILNRGMCISKKELHSEITL